MSDKKKIKQPSVKTLQEQLNIKTRNLFLKKLELDEYQEEIDDLQTEIKEKKEIINKFIQNSEQFRDMVDISESSKINHDICIERHVRDYNKFWEEVNELRRYLLEIYRILNKYDMYKIKEESHV